MDKNLMDKKLVELFKEFNKNRMDCDVRKWETIKFFESIFTALIVASTGGIITVINFDLIKNELVVTGLLMLPICSCVSLCLGIRNLKRESRLLFMDEAAMFKILHSISLPNGVRKFLPGGEFVLPKKYEKYKDFKEIDEINSKTDYEKWIDFRIKEHKFLKIFNNIFILEILFSIVLIITIICYSYFS